MHTGYDNFWMHKNSRLKPVLNLPKNDNYSCALLTDNYKQMQSGGCPSHLSNFIPPQNNAASSHAKDHYRNSHDQSVWPSSVYSLPLMSSYANNLHPQKPFFTHSNNFVYSSPNPQAWEKHDLRHLETPNDNINIIPTHNTNSSILPNNRLTCTWNNENSNAQVPRIRVKDVFSLNNKSVQTQLGGDGHFGIRQQKEQLRYAAPPNIALEPQTDMEYIKYRNANVGESRKSSTQFEHRTPKQTCSNNQEQFQNSGSFYQQNNGLSSRNFEFSGGRQTERSLPLESFQTSTSASLLSQLLTQKSIQDRGLQNCQGNASGQGSEHQGHGGEKILPRRNLTELHNPVNYSDSDYSPSCGLNEQAPDSGTNLKNLTNGHCDLQENLPKTDEANLVSRNSALNILAKNTPSVTSKSPPLKEINNQQNCFIKVSIPYTGENTFIGLTDCDSTDRNSAVSLQNFFEQNNKNCVTDRNTHNPINDEENEVLNVLPPLQRGGQGCFINRHATPEESSIHDSSANEVGTILHKSSAPAVSTSLSSTPRNQVDAINQRLNRHKFDISSNKDGDFFQNSTGTSGKLQQKFSVKISPGDENISEQEISTNDFTVAPLTLKQESFHPEIESTCLQPSPNPFGDKEFPLFHRTIKTEENPGHLKEHECELGLKPPDVVSEALPKIQVDGCSSASKSKTGSSPDSEYRSDQLKSLKNISSERGGVQGRGAKKGREVSSSRVNYKSDINRHKLALLIQFLKKDEDSGSSSGRKENSCGESACNANSDSYRSRRKLNKASIVRNKNNSREMISLMSVKGSNFTCKASQISERSKTLENTEEGKSSCSKDGVMAEESIDVSKKLMKCNPCLENEPKKDDSWVTEPSNEVACLSNQQFQELSESPVPRDKCADRDKNAVINTLKAFQTMKTHFCVSCSLASSIESFWINVVSGEVRCLNCFKKVTSKTKRSKHVLKSESQDLHYSPMKRPQKSKTEKGRKTKDDLGAVGGSNWSDEDKRKKSSKCEDTLRKWNETQENVRLELLEVFGSAKCKSNEKKETTNCSSRKRRRSSSTEGVDSQKRKSPSKKGEELVGRRLSENVSNQGEKDVNGKRSRKSSGDEDLAKRERQPSSNKQGKISLPKEQDPENGAKQEIVLRSEKSLGKSTSRSEDGSECRAKKEAKGDASSNRRRNSDAEEFRSQKLSVIDERSQSYLKVRHCADESARKPPAKETCPPLKDDAAEEAAKGSARHETSDKSKSHSIWREGRNHQKLRSSRLFAWRDPSTENPLARSAANQIGVENKKRVESTERPRKRKNLDEDFSPRKVHIVQGVIKSDTMQGKQPSKSPETRASKENDNSQRGSLLNARISAEKWRKSDSSKEECVLFGEHLKKEGKSLPDGEKAKAKDLWKGTGFVDQAGRKTKEEKRGPQKGVDWRRASDSWNGPRRKSSDEESVVPKARILTHFNRGVRESFAAENLEKKKSEEKEGNGSSEKMPKVPPTDPDVLRTPVKEGHSRRPESAIKSFKEKQSSKVATGPIGKLKAAKDMSP